MRVCFDAYRISGANMFYCVPHVFPNETRKVTPNVVRFSAGDLNTVLVEHVESTHRIPHNTYSHILHDEREQHTPTTPPHIVDSAEPSIEQRIYERDDRECSTCTAVFDATVKQCLLCSVFFTSPCNGRTRGRVGEPCRMTMTYKMFVI